MIDGLDRRIEEVVGTEDVIAGRVVWGDKADQRVESVRAYVDAGPTRCTWSLYPDWGDSSVSATGSSLHRARG
jgi:hypothetical protein